MTRIVPSFSCTNASSGALRLGREHRKAALRMMARRRVEVLIAFDADDYRRLGQLFWNAMPPGSLVESHRWEDMLRQKFFVQVRMSGAQRSALRLPPWARIEKEWPC